MIQALITVVLFAFLQGEAWSATRYIAPSGSDANNGQTTSTPWQTWTHALANTACGDILIARDGTYTTVTNGTPIISKVCTVGSPYTIRAENERMAHLSSNGSNYAMRTLNAAYIVLEGLRFSMVDLAGSSFSTVQFRLSNHITMRRGLAVGNNRYGNTHVVELWDTDDSLVEESEAHLFHRHGFIIEHGVRNVFRRNYCHPHLRADIAGGYASATPTSGENCFIIYPGDDNVIENNIAEGFQLKGYAAEATNNADRNLFLGNIAIGAQRGLQLDSRVGTGAQFMPKDNTIRDHVSIDPTIVGFYLRGTKNTQVINSMSLGTGSGSVSGFIADLPPTAQGDGAPSVFFTNTLAHDMGTNGYNIGASHLSDGTNVDAFSNGTNYASDYAWTSKFTTDPQLGTCKVWRPDGSAAKTNNWGADILFRYIDGAITTTPLWDPTVGEFPHGAIIAGVNDTPGESVATVHTRLNVNTGGCSFPAGYGGGGGGGPADPPGYSSSSGTGSISQSRTIAAAQDGMLVFIHLRDGGSNVGSVTGVTSSCGSEAFTFVRRATSTPTNALHAVESWYRAAPTSGTCTISATTSGTITSWILTSVEVTDTSGVGNSAGAGGLSASPTVTVTTESDHDIYSATSGASSATISAGSDQTLQTDTVLSPSRLAVSTQSGADGGVTSYVQGSSSYWAMVAVSMAPPSPGGPSGATLTQTKYQLFCGHGTESGSCSLGPDVNTQAAVFGTDALARVRVEIQAGVATTSPFGVALYCRNDAGAYARVQDAYGSNAFRFVGAGADSVTINIPPSLTPTTQRLSSGSFVAGAMLRDQTASFVVPALTSGSRTEIEFVVHFNLADGETADCQARKDDGTAFDTYTMTPRVVGRRGISRTN